jgi:two-component system sensor histidine kinase VicK
MEFLFALITLCNFALLYAYRDTIFCDRVQGDRVDKAKTEFVSLASHQLRTPLSTMNWYTEMLLAGDVGKLTKTQKEYLHEIQVGGKRMVDLVNTLLDVSRIDLGTFTVVPEQVDVIALSKRSLADSAHTIAKKKLIVDARYTPRSLVTYVDQKLARMVIENVLSNAIKFTPNGGHILFSVSKTTDAVLITVTDDGYGIPKNQQDKIFSKLFRADNVKMRDTVGTGLGLYVSKAFVDYLEGEMWFESTEGHGSTFYVRLPLRSVPSART